jgi:hypothetical protein
LVVRDTVNATVAGKVPGFKYYKVKGDNLKASLKI